MADLTTHAVLGDEANAIHGSGKVPPGAEGTPLYVALNALKSAAWLVRPDGSLDAACRRLVVAVG